MRGEFKDSNESPGLMGAHRVLLLGLLAAVIATSCIAFFGRTRDEVTPFHQERRVVTPTPVKHLVSTPPSPQAPTYRRREARAGAASGTFGQVLSDNAVPLDGATVCFMGAASEVFLSEKCTETNDQGRFHLVHTDRSEARLLVSAPLHQARVLELEEPESSSPPVHLVVELEPNDSEVSGRVIDSTGGVVGGARVNAWVDGAIVGSAVSNSTGSYRLGVTPGLVRIEATATAYSSASRQLQAPRLGVDLILTPASTIVGKVVESESGHGVAGATITAINPSVDSSPHTAVSGPDGTFEIARVAVGVYSLDARHPQRRGEAVQVAVGVGETTEPVTIPTSPATHLSGTLLLNGEPCQRGFVRVGGPAPVAKPTTSDGRFQADGLKPGRYLVNYSCLLPSPTRDRPPLPGAGGEVPTVGGEEFIDVEDEPVNRTWELESDEFNDAESDDVGSLAVTIQASSGSSEAFGAVLMGSVGRPAHGRWQGGALVFERLRIGEYELYLEQAPAIREHISITHGGQVLNVQLAVPESAEISGQVVDEAGFPMPDVWVRAYHNEYPSAELALAGEPQLTGAEGTFRISRIFSGLHRVVADGPSGVAVAENVQGGNSSVVLRLAAGAADSL